MNPKLSGFGLAAAISVLFWVLTLVLALSASSSKAGEAACRSLTTSGPCAREPATVRLA